MSWWRGSRDYEIFADSVANEARATVRSLKPGDLEAHYDRTGVRLEEFNWKCACVLGAMHKHLAKMDVDVMLPETLPPDWVFEDVAERALGAAMTRDFEPNVGRTQGLLAYDFARLPVLRDIPAADRWRLLVDRATVDALDDHGIDTANPLLAFAFDIERGYSAESVAKGWIATFKAYEAKRPIEPRLIDHLRERCGLKFTAEAKIFGVQLSEEGCDAQADYVLDLARRLGIGYQVKLGERLVAVDPDPAGGNPIVKQATIGLEEYPGDFHVQSRLAPTNDSVRALLRRAMGGKGVQAAQFARLKTSPEALERAIGVFVSRYRRHAALAEKEDDPQGARIKAATTLYRDLEYLHPLDDGNFRVFGKFLLNLALLAQGLGPTELYDPNRTDGDSPEANVAHVRNGQAWLRELGGQPAAPSSSRPSTPNVDDAIAHALADLWRRQR